MYKIILTLLISFFIQGCMYTPKPPPGKSNTVFENNWNDFYATSSVDINNYKNIYVAQDFATKNAAEKMFKEVKNFILEEIDDLADKTGQKKTTYFEDNKNFVALNSLNIKSKKYMRIINKEVDDNILYITIGLKKDIVFKRMDQNIKMIFGPKSKIYRAYK